MKKVSGIILVPVHQRNRLLRNGNTAPRDVIVAHPEL